MRRSVAQTIQTTQRAAAAVAVIVSPRFKVASARR